MTTRRQGKAASAAKLGQVTTGTGKRYVRRGVSGQFVERNDAYRPLRARTAGSVRAAGGTSANATALSAGGASRHRRKPMGIGDYLALVRRFPLRPIRDEGDYDAALEVLDGLVTKDEGELTAGERDYLDTLTLLVERYEDDHHRIDPGRSSPVETLKYLMDQSGMGVADLGRLIGSQPAASMIVHGRRDLSKAHIRKLADHFKVEPGLFL
jgi:HTH-type transcriptional regulator / antitoxin HigA